MQSPATKLDQLIRARYPLIAIISHEESRVLSAIKTVANDMRTSRGPAPRRVVEWALTSGLTGIGVNADEYSDPNAALEFIAKFDEKGTEQPTIFVMKDLHRVMENDLRVVRFLRDIAIRFEIIKHNLLLLSPVLQVPADVEKQIAVIDWPLPDLDDLSGVIAEAERDLGAPVSLNGKRDTVVQALRGLTDNEAANVLRVGVVATGELGEGILSHILEEKRNIIRKSGILEYFDATVTMNDVGGLDELKKYASRKRMAMSQKAREAGVDFPKGVLLVGPPGTGKSLSAKAIAGGELPLLRLDMSKILGDGRVGAADGNITSALKVVEAVAPCILWIDEAEKATADNNGASDGGVMMRVIGIYLTWREETTAPVYTVATVNSVSSLRPELMSRFDDVVMVDLPDAQSREEILRVHLAKRGVKNFKDLKAVVDATWGYSGREIEKAVKFGLERAFFDGKSVTAKHLLEAAQGIVPTVETKKEEIESLRTWAKGKAIPAGRPLEDKPVFAQANKKVEM